MNLSIKNRCSAGRYLANALDHFRNRDDIIVLAIPCGGVPIALEITQRLRAALDVIMVRKLDCPQHPGLTFGAITSDGKQFLLQHMIEDFNIDNSMLEKIITREHQELQRLELCYRGNKPWPILYQKIVILVDDGLSSGETMHAAVESVRDHHPSAIIIAAPVASRQAVVEFRALVDEVICLATPEPFISIGQHYLDFTQVSDMEVCDLLSM